VPLRCTAVHQHEQTGYSRFHPAPAERLLGPGSWKVATLNEMTQSEAVGALGFPPVMEKEPVITASDVGYDHIHAGIKSILGGV
jgi:hypothetical protein